MSGIGEVSGWILSPENLGLAGFPRDELTQMITASGESYSGHRLMMRLTIRLIKHLGRV